MDTPKHRFFAPPACFEDGFVNLPEDEARHAARVLRLAAGDGITVVDGSGGTHVVRLEDASRNRVRGRILGSERDVGESPRALSVGLALLKNRGRFETFLEKAVELGVDRIVPLETARTERQRFRRERAESILISALKQSGRSRIPELTDVRTLDAELTDRWRGAVACDDAADGAGESALPIRLIAHEAASRAEHLVDVPLGAGGVQILVGPEGGFTDQEVIAAVEAGYRPVWMGPRRLRAETAALTAAGVLRMRMDRGDLAVS